MFIPNPKIVSRFADTRLSGCVDELFENSMRENNNINFDYIQNNLTSENRLNNCVNEIMEQPDEITNVNRFGDQQAYKQAMLNNLNTANFANNRRMEDDKNFLPNQQTQQTMNPSNGQQQNINCCCNPQESFINTQPIQRGYYMPPPYYNTNYENNYNKTYHITITKRTLIIVIISIILLIGLILFGVFMYRNNKNIIKKLDLVGGDTTQLKNLYQQFNKQQINKQQNYNNDDYNNKQNSFISPMTPINNDNIIL